MNPFLFCTKLDQTILLGRRARNIRELLAHLVEVPEACVYYHTHRFLQQHHYLSPEPPNDFAYWIADVLNDEVLGEQVSSVDIVQFESISSLRRRFVELIDARLAANQTLTECPPGAEFHFMASRTFVLKTPYVAHTLHEFFESLKHISINALYYHIFDAKLRLARGENDFSRWFRDIGYVALADEVKRLDPYTHTLEGLRVRILNLGRKYDPA